MPYSAGTTKEAVKAASTAAEKDLVARRIACRGLIMNCANAIRLQVNTQTSATATPASAYLKSFFEAHPTWKAFMPQLTVSDRVYFFMVFFVVSCIAGCWCDVFYCR